MYATDTVDDVSALPMWGGSSSVADVVSGCHALAHLHMSLRPRHVHELMEAAPMSSTNSFRLALLLLVLESRWSQRPPPCRGATFAANTGVGGADFEVDVRLTDLPSNLVLLVGMGRVPIWRSCGIIGCQRRQMIGDWIVVSMRWYMRMWWRWDGGNLWRRGFDFA